MGNKKLIKKLLNHIEWLEDQVDDLKAEIRELKTPVYTITYPGSTTDFVPLYPYQPDYWINDHGYRFEYTPPWTASTTDGGN